MNTKLQKLAISLVLMLVLMLTGCIGFGDPIDMEDLEKIDERVRETIEKTFPLPEQVVIRTHIGDDVRFASELSVDEVVAFYRDTYNQKGYEEMHSQILADGATLLFKKDGEKDVAIEVTGNDSGCDVHLLLKSATP